MINVTIWNENVHERKDEKVMEIYPDGMHNCIANFLKTDEKLNIRTATLEQPECGLTDEVLESTDVMLWWGHCRHNEVPDEIAEKVHQRVLRGMGIIFLHSAHFSKPFKLLMGTTCSLLWRDGDRERIWNIMPNHPIAKGVPDYFEIEVEEMYGERFDIPQPDELIFMGWFSGGEVFRSGCVFNKGLGKVFYFQPGHESNPTYHIPEVQTIITNAVNYVAPNMIAEKIECPHAKSLEETWNDRHPDMLI